MDATPRIEPVGPALATRAVVAVVRPLDPNPDVLRYAASMASSHGARLLVLGTLDPMIADWIDGVDVAGPTLAAAQGELFASCVETLFEHPLDWGVHVLWGRLAPELLRLTETVTVLGVVHGRRRRDTWRNRMRRRITGRLDRLADTLVLHAV